MTALASIPVASRRIAANAAGDAVVGVLSYIAAFYLADPAAVAPSGWALPWAAVAVILAGLPFGLATQHWRYAGSTELLPIAAASALAAALTTLGLQVAHVGTPSAAFPVIDGLCLCVLLFAARAAYRFLRVGVHDRTLGRPVLLVGTGAAADLFLRALTLDRAAGLRAAGLLSLGHGQTGRRIHGCPILGPLDEADAVLDRLPEVEQIVVAAPELEGARLTALLATAAARGVRVARAQSPVLLAPVLTPVHDDAPA